MASQRKIHQVLAADHDLSKIDPADDQVWQFTTETGEPPALALETSFGLRAFNMRIFPRFQHNRISTTDPATFFAYPQVLYYAPNFIHVCFSPFHFLDVDLRVWVPTSQVVVGQVNLSLRTDQPQVLLMEWAAVLTPFPGGSPMTATEYSINTVLAGKSENIEPVFLLTGAPRADLSANPGLGVNLSLRPRVPRQFTWALASLEKSELSFYTARKYSASQLEAEQLKVEMARKRRSLIIETEDPEVNEKILQSQNRLEQLILPAYGKYKNETYVQSRLIDHGHSHNRDASDSGPDWGIQTSIDAWWLSRVLLPTRVEFLKGILMNFIDQQAADGNIDMLTSWSGKRTGKMCTPVLASLAADLNDFVQDHDWLAMVYPALLRNLQLWFRDTLHDNESDFPQWEHPLQLGFSSSRLDEKDRTLDWLTFVRTTENPGLAALLYRECVSLFGMAETLGSDEEIAWLKEKADQLKSLVQSCWNVEDACFHNRDLGSHKTSKAFKEIRYRRNGKFSLKPERSSASFTVIKIDTTELSNHQVVIELTFSNRKKILLDWKDFEWSLNSGLNVLDRPLRNLRQVSINGLRRNESVSFFEPDYQAFEPSLIIPFWSGAATKEQCTSFFTKHRHQFQPGDDMYYPLPAYIRVMLLESLSDCRYSTETAGLFNAWYFNNDHPDNGSNAGSVNPRARNYATLDQLIPLNTFLRLSGISAWTANGVTLENINQRGGPITVQYGQTVIEKGSQATIIRHDNGESSTLTQPGRYEFLQA